MKSIFYKIRICSLLILACFLAGSISELNAASGRLRVKLATIAPEGTSYHLALERMAQEWEKVSNGQVRVSIFPGGIQGGEAAMVQRMRINSLNAALITANGLSKIVPEVEGLQSIPMMFRTLEEVDFINEKLGPKISKMLDEKGFVVLFWSDAGWVRFFSKSKIVTPDDLKRLKLFVWAGEPETEKLLRDAEMQPVPMETGEILTGLKTGYIEAVSMPPFAANANQIYREAPFMLDLNWAPLVGACVINKQTWDEIPAEFHEQFMKLAQTTGQLIRKLGRRESVQAVETMQSRWGLKVQPVNSQLEEQWREAARKAYPSIRGKIVPEDIFDEVVGLLEEYRSGKNQSTENQK